MQAEFNSQVKSVPPNKSRVQFVNATQILSVVCCTTAVLYCCLESKTSSILLLRVHPKTVEGQGRATSEHTANAAHSARRRAVYAENIIYPRLRDTSLVHWFGLLIF